MNRHNSQRGRRHRQEERQPTGCLVLGIIVAVIIVFTMWSNTRLTRDSKARAEAVHSQIAVLKEEVADGRRWLSNYRESDECRQYFAVYVDREKLADCYSQADRKVKEAESQWASNVAPILKGNRRKDTDLLFGAVSGIRGTLRKARELSLRPKQRIDFLRETKKMAPDLVRTSGKDVAQLATLCNARKATVLKAEQDYPQKKKDLDARLNGLNKLQQDAELTLVAMQKTLKSPSPDYAVIGDGNALINEKVVAAKVAGDDIAKRADQLRRSYSKTLIDMKLVQKPWKQVVRYEWSESSDWDTTSMVDSDKVYISMQEYDELSRQLAVNPEGIVLHSGSGYEVDIEEVDIEEEYYHKYQITENGRQTKTDWEPVSAALFDQNEGSLGMDIVVKPYGMYEDETLKVAAPQGMAYVGNPRYGHWSNGPRPGSFWIWYGAWSYLNSNRYRYDDWSAWNSGYRGRKPYYGRNKGEDQYGSYSADTRKRYGGSEWIRTGGVRDEDISVRGAGAARRAGGPGGGGK